MKELISNLIEIYLKLLNLLYTFASKKEKWLKIFIKRTDIYFHNAKEMGAINYEISCFNSIIKNKNKTLVLLELTLINQKNTKNNIQDNIYRKDYLNELDFKNL